MSKIFQKQTAVILKPANGQSDASESFSLNGYVESVVAYTRGTEFRLVSGETALPLIFAKMEDNNNGTIVPMIPIENFKQKGGEYRLSFKPLGFMANNQTFNLSIQTERVSKGTTVNDIEVFFYFQYGKNPADKITDKKMKIQAITILDRLHLDQN